MRFQATLFSIVQALRATAIAHRSFRQRLKERNMIAQLKLQDDSEGRWIEFRDGRVLSKAGMHAAPDVTIFFRDAKVAAKLLSPKQNFYTRIDAMKNFKMGMFGPDDLALWLTDTMSIMQTVWWKHGTDMGGGVMRYTNNTNGGPVHVDVKDGKILRIMPLDYDKKDPPGWTITTSDGASFTPPHKATAAPYAIGFKSMIYSPDRNLYPMKRVDFDPNGERNPQNRGTSEFERISWDEALDIVASEFKRVKRECGPGAIAVSHGSHHTWGNVGYYLSSLFRFFNLVGFTKIIHNPDSWEGWYWGAMHHWGNSMRMGTAELYGQVEDCLENCEMMVFWSSDPEATNGCYGGFEGSVRRLWAKERGIEFVHIDPYYNHTAALMGGKWIAPRPGTDPALAQAISQVWIEEDLYDKDFVQNRTTGFDEWAAYVMGVKDGTPKTPEWAEEMTGVPARDIRALARQWGRKRTYLGSGGFGNGLGGANRSPTGMQWARMMVILMAMQGVGRPGVNFGNMQAGTPIDTSFWFPGYAEGGISGDLMNTGAAVNTYVRIPHLLTMNSSKQIIPRMQLPEAILEGSAKGYFTDPTSLHGQFLPFQYPAPGHSPIQILYKYGGASFGTMTDSNRWVKMFRSENLPFVVSQSIWNEGETKFADIILPACTNFERWDIGEWSHAGGYAHGMASQVNHRTVVLQQKVIEPLGESKSDYRIFAELAQRLGMSAMFTEGMSELDWCKRIFDGSDLKDLISWKKFLKRGYAVVPAPKKELAPAMSHRWYYEGRQKDVPDPFPLPSEYTGQWNEGMQTQSGKIEFIPQSLQKIDDPDRPPLNRYDQAWETRADVNLGQYPLRLVSAHSRYSFHSLGDGKQGAISEIGDHRVNIGGVPYLQVRMSQADADARGIAENDIVELFNARGSVLCAACITNRLPAGIIQTYQASAIYDPLGEPGYTPDRGGCVNLLTSNRSQTLQGSSMGPNACGIEIRKWDQSAWDQGRWDNSHMDMKTAEAAQ